MRCRRPSRSGFHQRTAKMWASLRFIKSRRVEQTGRRFFEGLNSCRRADGLGRLGERSDSGGRRFPDGILPSSRHGFTRRPWPWDCHCVTARLERVTGSLGGVAGAAVAGVLVTRSPDTPPRYGEARESRFKAACVRAAGDVVICRVRVQSPARPARRGIAAPRVRSRTGRIMAVVQVSQSADHVEGSRTTAHATAAAMALRRHVVQTPFSRAEVAFRDTDNPITFTESSAAGGYPRSGNSPASRLEFPAPVVCRIARCHAVISPEAVNGPPDGPRLQPHALRIAATDVLAAVHNSGAGHHAVLRPRSRSLTRVVICLISRDELIDPDITVFRHGPRRGGVAAVAR